MNEPAQSQCVIRQRLRAVYEGQVLRLADISFAVLSKELRGRMVLLDLEATDGPHVALIGVPGARVSLREGTSGRFPETAHV